jgi:hypothetical protein
MPTGSKRGPNFLELVPGAHWERPVRRLGYLGEASPEVGLEGVELHVRAERNGGGASGWQRRHAAGLELLEPGLDR